MKYLKIRIMMSKKKVEAILPRRIEADEDDGMNVVRINGIVLLLK